MAYTFTSGNYTVWQMNVKNGVITGEVNNGLQDSNVSSQTYEKSLALYQELTKK